MNAVELGQRSKTATCMDLFENPEKLTEFPTRINQKQNVEKTESQKGANEDVNHHAPLEPTPVVIVQSPAQSRIVTYCTAFATLISFAALAFAAASFFQTYGLIKVRENHDVAARILKVQALTRGFSQVQPEGELYVEVALINRGNQKEIVREVFLCYSNTVNNFGVGRTYYTNASNVQLDPGDVKIFRLSAPHKIVFIGEPMLILIGIVAIAPDATDKELVWPAANATLAIDGNGAQVSEHPEQGKTIRVISNEPIPYHTRPLDGFR